MARLPVIIDVGSRSIKAYAACDISSSLHALATVNWDPIARIPTVGELTGDLESILNVADRTGGVTAIGTEATRRSPELASVVSRACERMGIKYRTISQTEEAELIRRAFSNLEDDVTIVNAGGGSIQLILPDDGCCLLPFGMTDLNLRFKLDAAPNQRRGTDCVEWICEQLPSGIGRFIYTGGERSYLIRLGVPLGGQGDCTKIDFAAAATSVVTMEILELEKMSPFGPGWMRGAVASNCIVEALFEKGGAMSFIPSDVNIAHGLLLGILS